MANARLLSMATQHRLEIVKLNNHARRDWQSIARYAQEQTSDDKWASFLRSSFPEIVRLYGVPAAQLSASLYDLTREQWIADYGVKGVKPFAADASLVMSSADEVIEKRLREAGFYIDRYFKGELTRSQVYDPASGLVTATVGDFSRTEQKLLAQEDDFAKGTKRVVRGTGCSFCRYKGWVEWQDGFYMDNDEDAFHKNCSCIDATEYDGGEDDALYQPWMDDFTDKFNKAREELSALQAKDRWVTVEKDGQTEEVRRKRDPRESITRNNILRQINQMES